jgi:hypothetical protein
MNDSKILRILCAAMMVAALAACAGPMAQKQDTAEAAREAGGAMATTQTQIDATLAALDQVVDDPATATKTDYDRYARELAKLRAQSARLDMEAADMRKQSQEYLATWQASHARIQNAELRAASEDRREKVTDSTQELESSFDTTRTSLDMLIRRLEDIRIALRNDLTERGVTTIAGTRIVEDIRPAVAQVKQDLAEVRQDASELADAIAVPTTATAGEDMQAEPRVERSSSAQ